MKEKIIDIKTAILAEKVGFSQVLNNYYYMKENRKMYRIIGRRNNLSPCQNSKKGELYSIENKVPLNFKDTFAAPTQELLKKYLMNKHDMYISITYDDNELKFIGDITNLIKPDLKLSTLIKNTDYEKTFEKCLIKALHILINKNIPRKKKVDKVNENFYLFEDIYVQTLDKYIGIHKETGDLYRFDDKPTHPLGVGCYYGTRKVNEFVKRQEEFETEIKAEKLTNSCLDFLILKI